VIFSELIAQLLGYLLRDFIGAAAPAFAYCNRVGERRSERARSFRSSLNQSTTLPIAMQTGSKAVDISEAAMLAAILNR
jgi:hypothetical protein